MAPNMMGIVGSATVAEIYWDSTNPIFSSGKDSSNLFTVAIMDNVNIICPTYNASQNTVDGPVGVSIIYRVPKSAYDSCSVESSRKDVDIVGQCRRPFSQQIITVFFREFTPNPNGLEFKSGQIYYFISTSDGSESGVSNSKGGLCSKYNMKLRFHVLERPVQESIAGASTQHGQSNLPMSRLHGGTSSNSRNGPPIPVRTKARGRPIVTTSEVAPRRNLTRQRYYNIQDFWQGANYPSPNAESASSSSENRNRQHQLFSGFPGPRSSSSQIVAGRRRYLKSKEDRIENPVKPVTASSQELVAQYPMGFFAGVDEAFSSTEFGGKSKNSNGARRPNSSEAVAVRSSGTSVVLQHCCSYRLNIMLLYCVLYYLQA